MTNPESLSEGEHGRPRTSSIDTLSKFTINACDEVGLITLWRTSRDVHLILLARGVRIFAYAGSTLILASHLTQLGHTPTWIGLFMTFTLVGDMLISLSLTLVADSVGRRNVLGLGALLMAASGVVFALSENYWVLLLAAVLGVISPSGNEIGPFRAVEESTLAYLTTPEQRSDVFAWYSLFGFGGGAAGMVICGWAVEALMLNGWSVTNSYRVAFWGYAFLGIVKFAFTCALSRRVEVQRKSEDSNETEPLLSNGHVPSLENRPTEERKKKDQGLWRMLLPDVGKDSLNILAKLCVLFAMDSFASGLAPLTWITYFFKTKFALPEGYLGTIFFIASLVQASSMLVASSLAKRIGNVKTMVFTHLPSALAIALIPVPPALPFALFFLALLACTQAMDTVPRSSFLAAVVLPHERTAIMGAINVVKTCSQSLSPSITGRLADNGLFWVAFVVAGVLKAAYDIGLLMVFLGHKPKEERLREERQDNEDTN